MYLCKLPLPRPVCAQQLTSVQRLSEPALSPPAMCTAGVLTFTHREMSSCPVNAVTDPEARPLHTHLTLTGRNALLVLGAGERPSQPVARLAHTVTRLSATANSTACLLSEHVLQAV